MNLQEREGDTGVVNCDGEVFVQAGLPRRKRCSDMMESSDLVYGENRRGPRTEHWGTTEVSVWCRHRSSQRHLAGVA